VGGAIELSHPTAVDVASGVTKEGGVLKDAGKVDAFIANVAAASNTTTGWAKSDSTTRRNGDQECEALEEEEGCHA
jgi:hypothetical protein